MPVSETSPLLSRQLATGAAPSASESFPSISAALLLLGDHIDRGSIADLCPPNVDVCRETAFRLVILLELRARKLRHKPESDIWNGWKDKAANDKVIHQLDDRVINAWAVFLEEYRTTEEIEQVLWTSFPVSDDSSRQVRVVDLLNADCPSQLICGDVVIPSLANLWKNGPSSDAAARVNSTSRIGLRYDALCTPRVVHFMELATHLTYFGLLVSYVMHPPYEPMISAELDYIGLREILLMVFSSSILIRPWTIFNVPFAITLLTFLLALPIVPFATGTSFNILLLCFVFHAFQFHFSSPPSPLFLFKVHQSLPFAHFLALGFYRIIFPITLFFLPIFILGTAWLSIALEETFFVPTSLFNLLPTPMQTRTTVLFMFFTLLAAIFCSLFIFVVQGRGLDPDTSGWDSYSSEVGRAARASFVRAVIWYSSPYTFPAPFSLLQALLINGPSFVVNRLGFQMSFARAEKILWRMTVGPVALVCGLVVALLP
ncbi:hypothetical protein B0H19DRAFT_1114502 [Mycena capillaripes]|nr:hypothetical protein B0H19DRAFT_1114502 [Mycena capillaripes]